MDIKLIELTLEGLASKIENLEAQNRKTAKTLKKLKKRTVSIPLTDQEQIKLEDSLIDTKEVLKILGISYNTLQTIVDKKLINPLRISPRRIRYSKKELLNYIDSL